MNEHKEQTGFYLVFPSMSSNEIFLENHAGRFTVLLPKEIHLEEEFHWEMALVELFWPKQDSLSVRENLWYEIQESKRKWKRTHIPTSLFYSVSSLLDYVRQGVKETFDITYDGYEQKVIRKLKENAPGVFKISLSNVLVRSLGFNMSLPFTKSFITIYKKSHFSKSRQTLGENGTGRVQSSETLYRNSIFIFSTTCEQRNARGPLRSFILPCTVQHSLTSAH